jgi:VIT1/CCC1 family predicted Fe2+/Mn2+ transporter
MQRAHPQIPHHRPLHRFRKRSTYRHHIEARRRERRVQERLELPAIPEPTIPEAEIVDVTPYNPVGTKEPELRQHTLAEDLHDWILGGQDGLVNVLGSILGVAIVTQDKYIIIVAGLASLAAESISMAAVAYTSVKTGHLYYHSQREACRKAIEENPILQREILIDIYERKGLSRPDAHRIVTELTKDKEVWLETLMEEHLRLFKPEEGGPLRSSMIVGFASLIGSFIPLLPFFFATGAHAIIISCVMSIAFLFGAGAASAKLTIGDWKTRGTELALIGGTAALVSFSIGFAAKLIMGV